MATSWLIGSEAGCDLVVGLPQVSGRHARLSREAHGYSIEDLGSTNGTYVNGARIAGRVGVSPGDSITIGLTTPMPWPPGATCETAKVLRIGRDAGNDLVIDAPTVSGRHAEVVWEGRAGEATIRDLGSSNGTAIGSPERKVDRGTVTASDVIFLGAHPIPGMHLLARLDRSLAPSLPFRREPIVIGRDPSCDRVVDVAMVSGRHARLSAGTSGGIIIEDLGSSNGTFVNARRIVGATPVKAGDLVSLGSHTMLLAVESARVEAHRPVAAAVPRSFSRPDVAEVAGPPAGRSWVSSVAMAILVAVAPLVGLAIVALGDHSVAPTLAWLGLAAIGFGLADATCAGLVDARRLRSAGDPSNYARLAGLVGLCSFQCVLAWGAASLAGGANGPGPASLPILILAALAGLALGLAIDVSGVPLALARTSIVPILLASWLLGGQSWPYAAMPPWVRAVADGTPSRWAFEAMIVGQSDRPLAGPPGSAADVAESYFPAMTLRSGPRAATIALGLMLLGLVGGAGFIAAGWPSVPSGGRDPSTR